MGSTTGEVSPSHEDAALRSRDAVLPRTPDLVIAQCYKPLSEELGRVVLEQREAFLYTGDQLLLRESVYCRHSCQCVINDYMLLCNMLQCCSMGYFSRGRHCQKKHSLVVRGHIM